MHKKSNQRTQNLATIAHFQKGLKFNNIRLQERMRSNEKKLPKKMDKKIITLLMLKLSGNRSKKNYSESPKQKQKQQRLFLDFKIKKCIDPPHFNQIASNKQNYTSLNGEYRPKAKSETAKKPQPHKNTLFIPMEASKVRNGITVNSLESLRSKYYNCNVLFNPKTEAAQPKRIVLKIRHRTCKLKRETTIDEPSPWHFSIPESTHLINYVSE